METNETWMGIVKDTMKIVRKKYPQIALSMEWGVYYAPENYFVSYIFSTDQQLENAKASGLTKEINKYHLDILRQLGYPAIGLKDCSFDSQETCDRLYKGNWYYYFK